MVVVYEDKNKNGQLDLVSPQSNTYVDHVIAAGTSSRLVYVEADAVSEMLDPSGDHPAAGYNLSSACDFNTAPSWMYPGSTCPQPKCLWKWLPSDATLALDVSSDPTLDEYTCENTPSEKSLETDSTYPKEQPEKYPDPCDPNVLCDTDNGASYGYYSCNASEVGVCGGTVVVCKGVHYERPDPTPPGWPCQH
jgi:hypothetical protein